MSDDREYKYLCRGCQTDADGKPVTKVRDGINDEATAETLAKIHAIKTGHSPEVMPDG